MRLFVVVALDFDFSANAGAIASGSTVTEIAEREGISRALASRHVNSPECRQLIAEFVSDELELMRGLFYRALHAIEQGFDAVREYPLKDGQVLYGGPDHYARLSAVKHLRDFLTAGRPSARPVDDSRQKRQFTLEDIEEALRNAEDSKSAA